MDTWVWILIIVVVIIIVLVILLIISGGGSSTTNTTTTPTLTTVVPSSGTLTASTTTTSSYLPDTDITITGTNFGTDATLVSGRIYNSTFTTNLSIGTVTDTVITAIITTSTLYTAGIYNIDITVNGVTSSNYLTFTVISS